MTRRRTMAGSGSVAGVSRVVAGHTPPATRGGREDECVDGKTKSSSNKEDITKVNVGQLNKD